MTGEERTHFQELIDDPPPGSKLEAAKQAGVNLQLMLYLLSLTPKQRVERMLFVLGLHEQLAMQCGGLGQSSFE